MNHMVMGLGYFMGTGFDVLMAWGPVTAHAEPHGTGPHTTFMSIPVPVKAWAHSLRAFCAGSWELLHCLTSSSAPQPARKGAFQLLPVYQVTFLALSVSQQVLPDLVSIYM